MHVFRNVPVWPNADKRLLGAIRRNPVGAHHIDWKFFAVSVHATVSVGAHGDAWSHGRMNVSANTIRNVRER